MAQQNMPTASLASCSQAYPDLFNTEAWQWFAGSKSRSLAGKLVKAKTTARSSSVTKYKAIKHQLRAGKYDQALYDVSADDMNSPGGDQHQGYDDLAQA